MSYLTEYFDNYREHPIRKTKPFKEIKFPTLGGAWKDPAAEKRRTSALTDAEIKKFIAKTMKELKSETEYYNRYCAHLPEDLKTRIPVPRKKDPCQEKQKVPLKHLDNDVELPHILDFKDTEVIKHAREILERDMNEPTLKPLETHFRLYGYNRHCLFRTGLSEYTDTYNRLAYEMSVKGRK